MIYKPYITFINLLSNHKLYAIEPSLFFNKDYDASNQDETTSNLKNKKEKKIKKVTTSKRTIGRIASQEISIVSINIAGKLEERVEAIKKTTKKGRTRHIVPSRNSYIY